MLRPDELFGLNEEEIEIKDQIIEAVEEHIAVAFENDPTTKKFVPLSLESVDVEASPKILSAVSDEIKDAGWKIDEDKLGQGVIEISAKRTRKPNKAKAEKTETVAQEN